MLVYQMVYLNNSSLGKISILRTKLFTTGLLRKNVHQEWRSQTGNVRHIFPSFSPWKWLEHLECTHPNPKFSSISKNSPEKKKPLKQKKHKNRTLSQNFPRIFPYVPKWTSGSPQHWPLRHATPQRSPAASCANWWPSSPCAHRYPPEPPRSGLASEIPTLEKYHYMGVGQNLLLSILMGWTSINPSYFGVH